MNGYGIRCNKCLMYFEDDDSIPEWDEEGFPICPNCKTDLHLIVQLFVILAEDSPVSTGVSLQGDLHSDLEEDVVLHLLGDAAGGYDLSEAECHRNALRWDSDCFLHCDPSLAL